MVGITVTIGDGPHLAIDSHLRWSSTERSSVYEEDNLTVCGSFHANMPERQPVESDRGTARIWVVGEVHGFEGIPGDESVYSPKPTDIGSASYCARLYAEHGIEFIGGLNGNFLVIIHDTGSHTFSLATDRLGTMPLFETQLPGGLAFASSIQTVAEHPHVDPQFDVGYLHEYLVFKRSFGVKTPITGVQRHPPGSVTTIDLRTQQSHTTTYWRPSYTPVSKPFRYFVDRFVDIFETVLDEWIHDDRSYGLFLSGGSDSRLCLAALAGRTNVTALHMSGWMSREARMAERSAMTAAQEFRWLRRHPEYQQEALDRNPRIANFNGWFSQAYITGFHDEIAPAFDVLISGMYADTLFKGHALPRPTIDLGKVGGFKLPMEKSTDSVDEYIDWLLSDVSDEIDLPTNLRTVLEENIVHENGGVNHHGIHYESLEDLVQSAAWYPLTNDDDMIFWNSMHHLRPYRTPYLDNRLIELALEMPRKYQIRRNIINRALAELSPELAAIPHAHTGISPSRSYPMEYFGTVGKAFWQKHVRDERPPKPFLSNGPWVDDAELLRTHDFARRILERKESVVRGLPFLDWDDVMACYERHLSGENRLVEIYGLLTLLNMPITESIVGDAAASAQSATWSPSGSQAPPRPTVGGHSNG